MQPANPPLPFLRALAAAAALLPALLGLGEPASAQSPATPPAAQTAPGSASSAAEGAAPPGAAQAPAETHQAPAEPPQASAGQSSSEDANRSELERARAELERARDQLESAAREVARLSAQVTAPVAEEIRRQFGGAAGQRAMLGINIDDADGGARVEAVSPGGPAEEAGIRTGDVITGVNGQALAAGDERSPSRELVARLSGVEPGEGVRLHLRRDGGERDVTVRARDLGRNFVFFRQGAPGGGPPPRLGVGTPPQGPIMAFSTGDGPFPIRRWRDMELVSLTADLGAYFGTDKGILVVRAPRDDTLQLRDGDVILGIGDRTPTSPEHAMRILSSFEPGETLHLTIMRQQKQQTLDVKAPGDGRRR